MIEVVSEQEARTMQNPYHGSITEDVPVSESELVALAKGKRRTINVALVGNPNCGKTSLFNIASGAHEHVGNYSGVTVDAKEGFFDFQGYHFRIVDLPEPILFQPILRKNFMYANISLKKLRM